MKKALTLSILLGCALWLYGGTDLDPAKKKVAAVRTPTAITIDGSLSEPAWLTAEEAKDFVTLEPNPGEKPDQPTEVKILFDDSGIYIGALLHDADPKSIPRELSQRDNMGNTDWFGVFLDAYRDGINGVGFILTASGVQFDAKYSVFGEDDNWDAVWESAVAFTPEGWVAEIKIPYSAIRFPKTDEQTWHINFGRQYQRKQQKSFWSPINPEVNGLLNQSGYLTGIQGISSPFRLQATPFVAVYGQYNHDKTASPKDTYGRSFNGGMDIKYGISDAYTLDMTLIPDFGEAQSDNQVLNLSPFEVRFDENRQFFTEGTELFNKGNLFYSRRVGGTPLRYNQVYNQLQAGETVIENPQQAQLLNATKISGRSKKGLGLGLFNATVGRSYATIRSEEGGERRFETDPLSNYSVFVMDQNLPNNSYVTLINTTVWRDGEAYDANVTGAVFDLRGKKNAYSVNGSAKLSQKYRPGATDLGHTYTLSLEKVSGNLNGGVAYNVESDTYDPNDLGYIFNNNERSARMFLNYNIYKSFGGFNRGGIGTNARYSRLYNPDKFNDFGTEVYVWAETKSFWNLNAWANFEPFITYDYFEPRTPGRYYRFPTNNGVGFWVGSDDRKQVRISLNGNYRNFAETGRHNLNWSIGPRFRVSDKFNVRLSMVNSFQQGNVGYVNKVAAEGADTEMIIFGRRNVTTVENVLSSGYTFNENMALTIRIRHYWTRVHYLSFHELLDDGGLGSTDYQNNHDANFNAFNVDMIYRWRFAPGSDLFVIWKNNILNYQQETEPTYLRNLNGLFQNPQANSLSVKLIYFLDYASLIRHNRTFTE